jgi:hypothetical protein
MLLGSEFLCFSPTYIVPPKKIYRPISAINMKCPSYTTLKEYYNTSLVRKESSKGLGQSKDLAHRLLSVWRAVLALYPKSTFNVPLSVLLSFCPPRYSPSTLRLPATPSRDLLTLERILLVVPSSCSPVQPRVWKSRKDNRSRVRSAKMRPSDISKRQRSE